MILIDNRRLAAVTVPMFLLVMLETNFLPSIWLDIVSLSSGAMIAGVGIWVGIKTWQWAKAENA